MSKIVFAIVVVIAAGLWLLWLDGMQPVPFCKIIGDHEINDHHCIPYCPPKPSECG